MAFLLKAALVVSEGAGTLLPKFHNLNQRHFGGQKWRGLGMGRKRCRLRV